MTIDTSTLVSTEPPPRRRAVPVRHWGQWATALVVTILVAAVVYSVAKNDNIDYPTIGEFLFAPAVLQGLWMTFALSITSMVLGVILALAKMSPNRVLNTIANGYIWLFRGVPLLVQILIWGNFALLFPKLGLGIPFTDAMIFGIPTNSVIVPFVAAVLGLALHEAAYMAEIVRGGLLGVSGGQQEAAEAIGMTHGQLMRRIVLPQAVRVIIPPTGNQFISLLKASSLVAVISGGELLTAVQNISAANYRTIELLFVASFWYLVIVSVLSIAQYFVEKRVSRGYTR